MKGGTFSFHHGYSLLKLFTGFNHTAGIATALWLTQSRKESAGNHVSEIRLGIPHGQAYPWSRTRMDGWAVAQSPIQGATITMERLITRGYESMFSYYVKVSPYLNEPLLATPA